MLSNDTTKPGAADTVEWDPRTPDNVRVFLVRVLHDTHGLGTGYLLEGPRGKRVGLMRNRHDPHTLFSYNFDDFTKSGKVCGFEWFSDKSGCLRPLK